MSFREFFMACFHCHTIKSLYCFSVINMWYATFTSVTWEGGVCQLFLAQGIFNAVSVGVNELTQVGTCRELLDLPVHLPYSSKQKLSLSLELIASRPTCWKCSLQDLPVSCHQCWVYSIMPRVLCRCWGICTWIHKLSYWVGHPALIVLSWPPLKFSPLLLQTAEKHCVSCVS